jgi:drug/metabolite transporter (DMT)-like permease
LRVVQTAAVSPAPQAIRSRSLALGVMCGLAVALVWSGWSVATRFAVTTALGPLDVTFLRFGVSGLLLWPVLLRKGLGLARIGSVRMIVMLMGAGVPFMLLSSTGMQFAPAPHVATLMIGVMPIFVALLSVLLFGEQFTKAQIAGLVVVVAGVLCIGGHSVLFNRSSGEWRGDLLFMLAGLLFAGYSLAQRRSGISSWHATALVNVFSGLVFTPLYFLVFEPRLISAPWQDVAVQVLAQGIGVAILGLFFYAEAARRLGAPRAAVFGCLTPACSVLLSAPLLGEIPSSLTLVGVGLVTAGVVVVVMGARTP